MLVREGFVRVYDKYKEDTKYYDQLKELEKGVKIDNKGVWGCKDPKEGCKYVASKNSKKYHKPDCKWAKKIKKENLICFKTRKEAENEGYKPCQTCLSDF